MSGGDDPPVMIGGSHCSMHLLLLLHLSIQSVLNNKRCRRLLLLS